MIKKPFFGWGRPKLKYPVIQKHETDLIELALGEKVIVLFGKPCSDIDEDFLKVGNRVKTGQRLSLRDADDEYFISPATGTVTEISEHIGYLGVNQTSISIKTEKDEQWDDEFRNSGGTVSSETAVKFLGRLPGCSSFASFVKAAPTLDTIVIKGIDEDLLITTNQFIINSRTEALKEGIGYLRRITDAKRIILVVPPALVNKAEETGTEVKVVDPVYPQGLPEMVMKKLLDRTVPEGKTCEQMGVGFISSEAVASLADAFGQGRIPVHKIFALINKQGLCVNIKARIGTPVKDVLGFWDIHTYAGDRLVLGGPMRGKSIYSEDTPVSEDTDAIMIQDKERVILYSDTPCFNCGECVRACPANLPVNMLVRVLENGLYEEAAQEYDLLSCIECGLCAYVCVARIPVYQFIMLGKYEFEKLKSAEELNA